MKKNCEGFTLVETAAAIIVMGIMIIMIGPKMATGMEVIRAHAASQKLISDIRYIRELALSYHQTYGIEFNTAQNSYQLFQVNAGAKVNITNPYTNQTTAIDFDSIPQFSGVQMTAADTCQGVCAAQEIRIDSFGQPYDANGTALANDASITLQAGASTRTVQIVAGTAYCRVV